MAPDEFLGKLDLGRSELAAVRIAHESGNTGRALAELLAHFRRRTAPKWYSESPVPPTTWTGATKGAAEAVLRREYTFVGKTATLTHDLDWNADPLKDVEWPIELNRHGTWVRLINAYNRTGNPAYAEDFVFQLQDWCSDNPRPERSRQARRAWRTLECGIRLSGSWPHCFFGFLRSPRFTPDVMATMLSAMWQQADYLMQFHGGGNWLVTETAGLTTCGVLFPEFAESARWLETAFARLEREIDQQVPPDGAQIELTPHYHGVTLRSFHAAVRIAELNGVAVPAPVKAGIMRMVHYLAYVAKPDGHIPMFNDSDHGSVLGLIKPFATDEHPDLQFLRTEGTLGREPPVTSIPFRYAGQYVMRSGWDPDALYLAFDAGPYGLGHQHEDKLQIDVHAFGRSHILDPGRYTYAHGPWRGYFVSTQSHSTMLVDGLGQDRRHTPRATWVGNRARSNLWITNDVFDFAVGAYEDSYGGRLEDVIHVRKIFFKRGEYWIVHDLLLGKAPYEGTHTAGVQFQFGAAGARVEDGGQAVMSRNQDANLAIMPVSDRPFEITLHEGEEDPPRGWIGWSLHRAWKEPATLAVVTQRARLPMRIDTLLLPYRGSTRPEISIARLPEDSSQISALRIISPDWIDTYTCAHGSTRARLERKDATSGELAWIRRDANGEILATAGMGTPMPPVTPDRPASARQAPALQTGSAAPGKSSSLSGSQAIRFEGRVLHCQSPGSGRLLVDYGFAEGGGYLFHVDTPVQAGLTRLVLYETRTGRCYVYRALILAEGAAPIDVSGTFRVSPPAGFTFDDGDEQGWVGGRVVEADPGRILRAERDPAQAATYITVGRPVRYLIQPDLMLGFRYRAPAAEAGDWFYCKAFLEDTKGRHWAAYFAHQPSAKWRTISLSRTDFRPDGGRAKDHPGRTPPEGLAIARVGFTLRKGVTVAPVPAVLELDDIVWSIR